MNNEPGHVSVIDTTTYHCVNISPLSVNIKQLLSSPFGAKSYPNATNIILLRVHGIAANPEFSILCRDITYCIVILIQVLSVMSV